MPELDPKLEDEMKKLGLHKDEDDHEFSVIESISIFKDLVQNKYLWTWLVTRMVVFSSLSINNNISEVYLTNDLGFPRETISIIKVVLTPMSILISFLCSYFQTDKPFSRMYKIYFLQIAVASFGILYQLNTFPKPGEVTNFTLI